MKRVITVLTIVFLAVSCKAGKESRPEELKHRALIIKHNIRYEKTFNFLYKDGKIDKSSEFMTELKEYDEKGNMIRMEHHNRPVHGWEKYDYSISYEYNKRGKCTLEKRMDGQGRVTEKTEYVYDKDGNLSEVQTKSASGESISGEKYTYGSRGIREVEASVYNDGRAMVYRKDIYGSDGTVAVSVFMDRKGNTARRVEYQQPTKKEKLAETYNDRNKVTQRQTDTFDGNGRLVKRTLTYTEYADFEDDRGTTNTWIYGYDRKSFPVSVEYSGKDGKVSFVDKFRYEKF